MAEVKVKVGKKVAADEKIDRSKVGSTKALGGEGASGQYFEQELVVCPHCDRVSTIIYDTNRYHWYTCCHCGHEFRA